MKEQELRHLATCCVCRRKVGQLPTGVFNKISSERFMVNPRAVQRQHGLEQMLGNVALAQVMGAGEDMAVSMGPAITIMICDDCVMEHVHQIFQAYEEQAETEDEA